MKILKLPPYYFPEQISSTVMTHDLEEAYVSCGFEMEVYAPIPTRGVSEEIRERYKTVKYEETYGGKIKIHRFGMSREGRNILLRAIRYIRTNYKQYRLGKKAKDVDVIMGASTPPTQGLLCARLAKKLSKKYGRKVPFIYTLQDVFPDILETTGISKRGSLLYRIGSRIERKIYDGADAIIVISEQIKENIMKKGVPEEKITVISNWIDTEVVKPVPKTENALFGELGIDAEKFNVVYAGNFGAAQGADVIIKAAELLRDDERISFVIFGGGSEFEAAKKEVAEKQLENVRIGPYLPSERISEIYSLGDVALISCKKGVGNSSLPSKVWSIMACGTPIIAAFDPVSELADILEKANAGVCVEPESATALAAAISAAADGVGISECGSREFVCKYASREVCVAKYIDLIRKVTE